MYQNRLLFFSNKFIANELNPFDEHIIAIRITEIQKMEGSA